MTKSHPARQVVSRREAHGYFFQIIRTHTPSGKSTRWVAQKCVGGYEPEHVLDERECASHKNASWYLNRWIERYCADSPAGVHVYSADEEMAQKYHLSRAETPVTCEYCGENYKEDGYG